MSSDFAMPEPLAVANAGVRVAWTGPRVDIEFGRMPGSVVFGVLCRIGIAFGSVSGILLWGLFHIHARHRNLAAVIFAGQIAFILAQHFWWSLRARQIIASPDGIRWLDFQSQRGSCIGHLSIYGPARVVRSWWAPWIFQLITRRSGPRIKWSQPPRRTVVIAYDNDRDRLEQIAALIEKARSMAPLRQTFEVIAQPDGKGGELEH